MAEGVILQESWNIGESFERDEMIQAYQS